MTRPRPGKHDWPAAAGVLLASIIAASGAPAAGTWPDTDTERAWSALLLDDHVTAAGMAESIIHEDPTNAAAIHIWIAAARELDDIDSTLQHQRPPTCATMLGEARILALRQDLAAADSLYGKALQCFREEKDVSGEIICTALRAAVRARKGRSAEQESLLTRALELAQRAEDLFLATWIREQLADMLLLTPRHADIAEHYEHMIEGAQALPVPIWEGEARMNLSILARWQMDLDRALDHRRAALEAFRRAGDLALQARALHYIAAIHLFRGEMTRAMRYLHEGLATAEEAGDQREVASCLGDLGSLYYFLGDEDRALHHAREAIDIYERIRSQRAVDRRWMGWAAGTLGNIGTFLIDQRRLDEALPYLERALSTMREVGDRRNEARVLNNLGRCLCSMGRIDEGVDHLRVAADSAVVWQVPVTEAYALADIGVCRLAEGDLGSAEASFARAQEVAEGTGFYAVKEMILTGRATVARRRGERDRAIGFLEEAMNIAEGVRMRSRGAEEVQTRYFATGRTIYEEAVRLAWEMGNDRQAFSYAQRAKARSLLDLLTEAEVDLRLRADPSYQQREQEILGRIGELLERPGTETEIGRLEDALLLLEEELRAADPRYAELKYPRPAALDDVKAAVLEPGELLLEYFLGDSASYVWAVDRDQVRFLRLPARCEIESRVRQVLPLLSDYNVLGNDAAYFAEPITRLSEALIGPLATECREARRVIVAPHGILHYLPFGVLLTAEVTEVDFAALPYLISSTEVLVVPSVSTLDCLRSARASDAGARGGFLLLGDPDLARAEERSVLARGIGGTVREIDQVRDLFPPEHTRILTHARATAAGLREAGSRERYRLIHIAAHGLFNERRPQLSGLLLSPDPAQEDDGFLAVGEVFGLDLPCDQLVLSACSSALGEEVTGEGLVGLTRAFLYAGARSVVAALWEVSGEATTLFMRDFYHEPAEGRASALAKAKRRMIAGREIKPGIESSHPYFWAGFVMTGEGH